RHGRPSARSFARPEPRSEGRRARRLGADGARDAPRLVQHRLETRAVTIHAGRLERARARRRNPAAAIVEIRMCLDVDLTVADADLDRLGQELALGPDLHPGGQGLEALGIEARAAVADRHAHAPRDVGAVNPIRLEAELEAILAERVVGITALDHGSVVALLADVIAQDSRRDDPGWVHGLARHG